jgi:hypothetical protein
MRRGPSWGEASPPLISVSVFTEDDPVKVTHPNPPPSHPREQRELGEVTATSDAVRGSSADVFDPRDEMLEPSDQLNEGWLPTRTRWHPVTPLPVVPT